MKGWLLLFVKASHINFYAFSLHVYVVHNRNQFSGVDFDLVVESLVAFHVQAYVHGVIEAVLYRIWEEWIWTMVNYSKGLFIQAIHFGFHLVVSKGPFTL